ncbi:fructose-bisphosphate aldolase/6-deoxy-5-ketofructose 1-phosphate synthase [Methanolinea mesophila]|uniref:aldolase n=1 Tax=Methanolinea mesophila TaxID=547055 RepID=UPI001AE571BD|nr:aldolase [Methanolinea mesophila]MBP1927596.1 fructose-bisphosphate aldolase/6-deoxy-5-ketofructose 1-phosphate synthase [Methanolinea mesophila]
MKIGDEGFVPLDVPVETRDIYRENYREITHGRGRLMLFAGDQKIEHLNDDFMGPGIHPDDADPEHLFRIAARGRIGVFATQLGLISRYGMDYGNVPYLVKLNSKTNLRKTADQDPFSPMLHTVGDVVRFRDRSGLSIRAVGYTVYPGSEFESEMLRQAARIVVSAHRYGLVTVLWMYPRGKSVRDETAPHLVAGAAGIAAALGSDFAKVNVPEKDGVQVPELLKEATNAGGRTKIICSGGPSVDEAQFLKGLYNQIHLGGTSGNATGRNIHQKSLQEAVRMCDAIAAISLDDTGPDEALKIIGK